MTFTEYSEMYPEVLVPTYYGEKADQGTLIPLELFPNEGFAVLSCGGTEVVLSYTALHLICGWIALGAHNYDSVRVSSAISRGFSAVTCEAASGRTPNQEGR